MGPKNVGKVKRGYNMREIGREMTSMGVGGVVDEKVDESVGV